MQIQMTPNTNKKQLQQPSTMASTNTVNMNIPATPTTPNRVINSVLPKPRATNPVSAVNQQIKQQQNVIPQPNIVKTSIDSANGLQSIQAPQVHYAMPTTAKGNSLGFNAGLLNSVLKNIATRQNANYLLQAQKANMNMRNQELNRDAMHNNLVSRLAELSKENALTNTTRTSIAQKNRVLRNNIANLNYDAKMHQAQKPLTPYQSAMIKQNRLRNTDKALMATYSPNEIETLQNNPKVKNQIIQHYIATGSMPKLNYAHHFFGSNDISIANPEPTQQQPQAQNNGIVHVSQLPIQQQYQIFKQQALQNGNKTL